MTCTQVFRRYSSDWDFRRKLDSGMSVSEFLAAERDAIKVRSDNFADEIVEAAEGHALVGKDASGELCSCGERVPSVLEHIATHTVAAATTDPIEVAKPKAKSARRSAAEHGTTGMYAKGCHDGTLCPRGENGKTCREAYQEYQREYAARRKANAGAPLVKGADKPKPVPKPKPPAEPASPAPVAPTAEVAAEPVVDELAEARQEIVRLMQEVEHLKAQVAVQPTEIKRAEVDMDGMTVTVSVQIGRAA
jgi:hypothetical protein